jgi:universal stress protein E
MKRFKNVLVVYDDAIGGDDVIGQAVALARENKARLTITTVLREIQVSPASINETEKRLLRLAEGVSHAGVSDVGTKVLIGTPFMLIIREVIGAGHDLVIVGAKSGSALKDVFFGSAATHLMRKCPCPVWVVKPGQSAPFTRILAAVDPQPAATDDHLNIKIMDLATSLASRDNAVLHIVYAWDVDGNDNDAIKSELAPRRREAIVKQHNGKRGLALAGLLARYPMADIDHRIHLPREHPAQAISRLAKKQKIDLIVMGMAARKGISGFLIGNSAESVLSSVKCGMLTVKPNGLEKFISPPRRIFAGPREPDAGREDARHFG